VKYHERVTYDEISMDFYLPLSPAGYVTQFDTFWPIHFLYLNIGSEEFQYTVKYTIALKTKCTVSIVCIWPPGRRI
jgi:hypothetical protein